MTLTGNYSTVGDTGMVQVKIRNDSTATINGRVLIVITEDSLVYPAPNGVSIHHHVPRDYLPDDSGTTVAVAPGDSVVVTQTIVTDSTWVDRHLNLLAWIQNDVMQPDSTKEIWQGAVVKLVEIGIVEKREQPASGYLQIHAQPNPCVRRTDFIFNLIPGKNYTLRIFDLTGREIRKFTGIGNGQTQRMGWNLKDQAGVQLGSGVYLYRFETKDQVRFGKLIIL